MEVNTFSKKNNEWGSTFEAQTTKRVSFILSHKNRADILDKALMRCREFVGPEDELIIMDGGSTDHTREVVAKYPELVSIFVSEPDVQPAFSRIGLDGKPIKDPVHALNKGVLLARGKYIKTIGDDDIYHPQGIKQAIRVLEEHPEIDLLICGGTRERSGRIEYVYMPPGINYGKSTEDVFRYGRGCGVGHFFRRRALAQAGLHPFNVVRPDGEFIINPDAEYVLKFIKNGATVRFCRINLFHSPYSHYDYQALGFAQMRLDNFWMEAARRYCSPSFYAQYRIKRIFTATVFYHKMLAVRKMVRRKIRNQTLQKFLGKKLSSAEYIWDGGFS